MLVFFQPNLRAVCVHPVNDMERIPNLPSVPHPAVSQSHPEGFHVLHSYRPETALIDGSQPAESPATRNIKRPKSAFRISLRFPVAPPSPQQALHSCVHGHREQLPPLGARPGAFFTVRILVAIHFQKLNSFQLSWCQTKFIPTPPFFCIND